MIFKRIIYALLYKDGFFWLSRNFSLQKVGDISWLKNNYGFGETCNFIDELMIINISEKLDENNKNKYFKDINVLREKIFVPIILGGGIRKLSDARDCFNNGADKILINSLIHDNLKECEKISKVFGEQAITIMIDFKKTDNEFLTFINSGKKKSLQLKDILSKIKSLNFGELILNSIDKDGTAAGLDLECLDFLNESFKKPILIMGGAGKPEHFAKALSKKNISGVVTANLFNFLGNGLEEVRNYSIENKIRLVKF